MLGNILAKFFFAIFLTRKKRGKNFAKRRERFVLASQTPRQHGSVMLFVICNAHFVQIKNLE